MSAMDDIQKAVRIASQVGADRQRFGRHSVATRAKDAIFQFPCLVSDTVPVNMATATTRLLDRTYASFVQVVMSLEGNVNISIDPTPGQFLKRIHQNMKLESVTEDEERLIKTNFYDGNVVIAYNEAAEMYLTFEAYNGDISNIKRINQEACREWLSDFDLLPILEADDDGITRSDMISGILNNVENRNSRETQNLNQKIYSSVKAPSLVDHDVKKLNDMQPYALQVRLNVTNDNNEFVQYWDIIIGVKTVLHMIKSDEIIDNIARVIQNRNPIFNMIRWTTGEISLVKDILLRVNDVKFDMRNRNKGYSNWFPRLKRMRDIKIAPNKYFGINQLVPNSSLIISSYEVEVLEQKYGILIKDTAMAKRMINNLFLMAFVILDEGSQTMDIMYDNSDSFETYALETVQREVSLNSNRLANEIGRMISSR